MTSIFSIIICKTTHDPKHDEPEYLHSHTPGSSQCQVEIESHTAPTLLATICNNNINSATTRSDGKHAHQSEDEDKSNADKKSIPMEMKIVT